MPSIRTVSMKHCTCNIWDRWFTTLQNLNFFPRTRQITSDVIYKMSVTNVLNVTTGDGKSTSMLAAICHMHHFRKSYRSKLRNSLISIIAVPFHALKQQYISALKEISLPISVKTFSEIQPRSTMESMILELLQCDVLVISFEDLTSERMGAVLQRSQVVHFFVDEVHNLVLQSHFRRTFSNVIKGLPDLLNSAPFIGSITLLSTPGRLL